jgi:hypothetical protein
MIGYRRGREAADAEHERRADGEPTDVGVSELQRRFSQHQERAGHHEIVALDKANEGKDTDYQNVVAAEWDAVELASENVTGGQCRSDHRANFCHGELPDGRGRFVRSAILVLNLPT